MSVARTARQWTLRGTLAIVLSMSGGVALAWQQITPPPEAPVAPEAATQAPAAKKVVRTFKVYADNWEWSPETIRVKQGEHVVLKLHAYRATRSFVLKGYKLDVHMPQDQDVTVEFDADKKGEFPFKCGRPCGNGCAKLRGTLFVE